MDYLVFMRSPAPFISVALFLILTGHAFAQASLPSPDFVLHDTKHKEAKSGVHVQGNTITIQSGVGTPETINAISFSADGTLVAAAKDFGRVVVWDMKSHMVLRALDTGQRLVQAVAFSPDKLTLATAGTEQEPTIKLWSLASGKLIKQFPVGHSPVQRLVYVRGEIVLVKENGVDYVLDMQSGNHVLDLTGEGLAILSTDATELVTARNDDFVFRKTSDWSIEATIARPVKNAWPLAYEPSRRLLIYGTFFAQPGFHAAQVSGNVLKETLPLPNLPYFNPSAGYFASVDPSSGIVFLHSDARMWAWNIDTAKACNSPVLYSESGAFSFSGGYMASGLANGMFSQTHTEPGVEVWNVQSALHACSLL